MEDLPLGRISALVPEFAVKDLPLGRTLMIAILLTPNFVEVHPAIFEFQVSVVNYDALYKMQTCSKAYLL